ncbi:MAG: flagellar hook assembly protein FlgD [Rhodocyclaceae bacterium]|nr:flagellar hook assembly protein FlgD [Rhodocyclaceae bacterium]MBX3670678.1 flagellar hook assembly protein FlgD [Rhodocyclaceae bacterium]
MTTIQNSTTSAADLYASLNNTRNSTEATTSADNQNRFLTLLTTQLKNQDPLSPMDNAQITSQLAQISTVDGIERLNTALAALTQNGTTEQTMQAAALVGRGVLVPGSNIDLSAGRAVLGVDLPQAADRVALSVKDANGITVRTIDLGGQNAGTYNYTWDGATDNGSRAADGRYTFSVSAVRGNEKVSANALEYGLVTSVARSGGVLSLNLGTQGSVHMDDIKQIL